MERSGGWRIVRGGGSFGDDGSRGDRGDGGGFGPAGRAAEESRANTRWAEQARLVLQSSGRREEVSAFTTFGQRRALAERQGARVVSTTSQEADVEVATERRVDA